MRALHHPCKQQCNLDSQAPPHLHMSSHYTSMLAVAGSKYTRAVHNHALTGCTHNRGLGLGSCRSGGVPLQHIFALGCLVSCTCSLCVILICIALTVPPDPVHKIAQKLRGQGGNGIYVTNGSNSGARQLLPAHAYRPAIGSQVV